MNVSKMLNLVNVFLMVAFSAIGFHSEDGTGFPFLMAALGWFVAYMNEEMLEGYRD